MSEFEEQTGRTLAWKAMLATAKVSLEQGEPERAEGLYVRALQAAEKRLGSDHVAIASILMEMAEFYDQQDRRKEAEKLYLRVKEILAGHARHFLEDEEA